MAYGRRIYVSLKQIDVLVTLISRLVVPEASATAGGWQKLYIGDGLMTR